MEEGTKYLLKWCVDNGGSFLKVMMMILICKDEDDSEPKKKQRFSYATGVYNKVFQQGGVRKMFITSMAQHVAETYDSVKAVMDLAGVKSLQFVGAMDLKALLEILGLGCGSSTCNCPFCTLAKKAYGLEQFAFMGKMRTFGRIREMALTYMQADANDKELHPNRRKSISSAEWENCERMPLLDWPDEAEVLDIMATPQLHIFTGIPCKLFSELDKVLSMVFQDWKEAKGVSPDGFGEYSFNGNSVKKLLDDIDSLEDILDNYHGEHKTCRLIVKALRSFKKVSDSCMGMELDEDYYYHITEFMVDYRRIFHDKVILKAHILEVHVPQFFERQKALGNCGKGLAFWTEQPFEAAHSFWNQLWLGSNYKRDLSHPDYDSQLKRAGVKFNSDHL